LFPDIRFNGSLRRSRGLCPRLGEIRPDKRKLKRKKKKKV